MKKIVAFVPEFPVMSETFIERELSKLAELPDFDVKVLSLKKGNGSLSPALHDRVFYISLTPEGYLNGLQLLLKNLPLVASFVSEAFSNKNRSIFSSLYLISKAFAYTPEFKKHTPDHIHVHFLSEPSTLIYYVSRISGIPFSISAHARDVFGNNKDKILNSELVPVKAKHAQFIALCNRKAWDMCVFLAGKEVNTQKIKLHYHGIDAHLFDEYNNKTPVSSEKPFIFAVGRLEEKKGFTYLIKASKILKDRGISHIVKIAGPGPFYTELLQQINSENLQDYVSILGNGSGIDNKAVLDQMSQATLFALPSIETADNDAEGIPNTLVEASFLKKAIVSTFTGSIPELITTNINGLLVEQKNEHQLADALEKLIMDGNLRESMGNNAYNLVMDKFDLNKNILNLKEYFLE